MQHLEFVVQQMHTAVMTLTSYEANDIVANSRKNPLESWRRLQKRYGRNLLRTIISPGRCCLLKLQVGIERWESYMSRYDKKLKSKIDDEMKLAGLEALVPEELEKHLILNSKRLRTWRHVWKPRRMSKGSSAWGSETQDLEKLHPVHNLILWTSMQSTLLRRAKESIDGTLCSVKS